MKSKKKNVIVLFSGGRTSAYMCLWLKTYRSHIWNMVFVYANTSQEHEKSLDFINTCDIEMKLNLVWIEAVFNEKPNPNTYKIVDYESASRNGEVFENMVKRYGLPNRDFPHCTRELKIEAIKRYAKKIFGDDYSLALGIRADEPKRIKQSKTDNEKLYPLAHDHPMTKGDIINWWKGQNFDLQVPEHLGNCTWCWKKSDRKLWTIAKESPEIFDFPMMLEQKYKNTSNYDRKDSRVMFRRFRSAKDIIAESKSDFVEYIEQSHHQGTLNTMFINTNEYELRWQDIREYEDYEEMVNREECAEECGSFQ